jgi:hypothetical protein
MEWLPQPGHAFPILQSELPLVWLAVAPSEQHASFHFRPGSRHVGVQAMLKRIFSVAISFFAAAAPCQGLNLDAQLFPLTGEVRLRNSSAAGVPFAYYSITSPSGALNGLSFFWRSITDTYDASGNGFIDPSNNWTELSALTTQLTEGVFTGPGGNLPAFRSVSLGQIWNPALYPSHDLTFDAREPNSTPITMTVQFALAGDYNGNGTVNSQDYTVWRQNFGSTTSPAADGNLNGIVDGADYIIWRNNFGLSLPGVGTILQGSGSGSLVTVGAVPEPGAALLLVGAGFTILNASARGRRAALPAVPRFLARR